MVPLDTGAPGTSGEIDSEDADGETSIDSVFKLYITLTFSRCLMF